MSPRSEEFMAMAREALAAAEATLAAGHPSRTLSEAYFAALYAARAALSEEDLNARTHKGAWQLFRETFVDPGRFDASLFSEAHGTQRQREGADYDALVVSREEAERVLGVARRFVAAVEEMIEA
jgi:uncharacterized protein (UPF0332 family)